MTTIDTRAYDDGGRLTSSSYNNGVSESRTYNTDNTLASISFTGAPIGDHSYGWGANKNKTSESITGTMSGYGLSVGPSGYDAEDRLVDWNRADANLGQAWNLSPVGGWNSITENASTQNRTNGAAHALLSAADQSLQHNAKGNMTFCLTNQWEPARIANNAISTSRCCGPPRAARRSTTTAISSTAWWH